MSRRRLLPFLAALVLCSPAVASPKTAPASNASNPNAGPSADQTARAIAAARLGAKIDRIIKHPEKATEAQLLQAERDQARVGELTPYEELQPCFHVELGIILSARAKAKRDPERTQLLERADVQFYLAALTHGIDAERGISGMNPRDVIDQETVGDATASFILYHCGLLDYELGNPSGAQIPLDLLLAAAADHKLERPEYVEKARVLLVEVKQAEEKREEKRRSRP